MIILADFITGLSIGFELFMGEDLEPGDRFAIQIDLVIYRFTFIFHKKEQNP